MDKATCSICGAYVALIDLDEHEHQHERQRTAACSSSPILATVACSHCYKQVPIAELDGHEEAHRLQQAEFAPGEIDSLARELQRQEEENEFKKLQMKYGFSNERPGRCFTCGAQGHWSTECPSNPKAKPISSAPQLSTCASELVRQQEPEQCSHSGEDLIMLLRGCLQHQPTSLGATAYLCGPVQHLCGHPGMDRGWGCGYRNIQMMVSHLLQRSAEFKSALFGGCGYIPSIASLQAWIEVAWLAGFDVAGADQLGHALRGTRKWIGTTEAAALLRYFGVQARVVDFRGPGGTSSSAGTTAAVASDGATIHHGVQCDLCGTIPIHGLRHVSCSIPNYDVCEECRPAAMAEGAGPFRTTGKQAGRPNGSAADAAASSSSAAAATANGGPAAGSSPRHDALVRWVWEYFAAAPAGTSTSSSSSPCGHVTVTSRPPLYFQHEGHSRTIVGIERRQPAGSGSSIKAPEHSLLVLDPGCPTAKLMAALRNQSQWQQLVKRGLHTLRQRDYQIMYVEDNIVAAGNRDVLQIIRPAAVFE